MKFPFTGARLYFRSVNTLDWLLDSDPAIRWQAMRDLTDASPTALAAERARVAHEGLGAEILAAQGTDGAWHKDDAPDWLPTLFTLQLLRATGVDRTDPAVRSAIARLEKGFRWHESLGGKSFFEGETEPRRLGAGDRGGETAWRGIFARALLIPSSLDGRDSESRLRDVRLSTALSL